MQVGSGVILVIWAAYKNGIINFETYSRIKKKYGDRHGKKESRLLRKGKHPER